MIQFQNSLRNIFIIIVSLLLLIPCSLKKELKHLGTIETNQPSPVGNNKALCSSYCDSAQNIKNQKEKKNILSLHDEKYFRFIRVGIEQKIALSSFYIDQKEKIPTYLLYEKFLI